MSSAFRGGKRRAWFLRACLAFLALAALPAAAAELRVLVDLDANPATGCTVSAPAPFAGVEQVFITTVDASVDPPVVTQVARQDCDPSTGTFTAPVVVSSGGWNVGVGDGTAGTNVIESSLGLPASVSRVRLGFVYADPAIGADTVFTGPGGAAIVIAKALAQARAIPTLSSAMLALLAAFVAGVGVFWARRHGIPVGPLVVLLFALSTTLAWAAIVLDGLTPDWAGIAPISDAQGDAPSGTDVAAVFATIEGSTLFVRADVGTGMPPAAVPDSYTALVGTPLVTPAASGVLANDARGTPGASVASFGGGSLGGTATDHAAGATVGFGSGGSLLLGADGSFTFTPPTGFSGSFTFDYRLANAEGTSDATVTIGAQQAPAITSANATTFNVGAAGSFTIGASGQPSPTISVAGALPPGVSYNATTHVLSGTPAAGSAGTYPLTITASNGVGSDATQSFTLTVNQDVAITSANAATFTVGSPGSFTVTATGSPTPTLSIGGALPSGVTFNAATGALAGTPAVGTGGTYPLTFTASNGVSPNATQSFTLTVQQAPAITSANGATFVVGSAGSFTVAATGFPAPTLSISGALPSGVTFDAATGALSGTPASATSGTYPLTFTASNGVGSNASQSFTLTVNQAAAITSAASTTFVAGSAGTFTITTSAFPAASTIAVSGTLPAGVTFTNHADGTATLAGTASATGNYPLTITASNGVGATASQAFTLVVGQAPSITSANATTFVPAVAGSFGVTATGFPAGASMTIGSSGTLPAGVTFTDNGNGTATLAGTPASGTAGTYPITLTASNGIAPNASQGFTLNVTCPVIGVTGATSQSLTYNTAMAASAYASSGGNGTIAWSALGLPAGVSIGASTGQLSGTPGATGSFAATIFATDAGGCSGALGVSISVAPSLVGKSYTTVGNTQLVAGATAPATPHVSANGLAIGDSSDTAISYAVTVAPAHGSLSLNADGTFVYTPAAGNLASDSFTYTGTSNGVTATQTATIAVSGMVWYVDNSSTGTHDGGSSTPFLGLGPGAANLGGTITAPGDFIYVAKGAGATTGDYAMLANQQLVGAGATLSVPTGTPILTVAGNSLNKPTLDSAITLASGASVSGLDMDGSGVQLAGSSVAGVSVSVGRFRRTGTGNAITLSGSGNTGALSFESVSAVGTAGAASGVSVSNFTGTFTVLGTDTGLTPNGGTVSGFGGNGMEFRTVSNLGSTSVSLRKMTLSGNGISQTVTGTSCSNLVSSDNLSCVANLYLSSVSGVSLDTMTVTASGQMGINGNAVSSLSIASSTVTSNGNEADESGILLQDASATTISGSTIKDNAANQVYVENGSGTTTFSLSTTTLGFTSTPGTNSQQGLLAATHGSATLTVQVDTATAKNNGLDGVQVFAQGSSTIKGYVKNSSFDTNSRGVGLFTSGGGNLGAGTGTPFTVQSNSGFTNNTGAAGLMVESAPASTGAVSVLVSANTLGSVSNVCNGTNSCDGILVRRDGTNTFGVTVSNNTVQRFSFMGIDVRLDQTGSSAVKVSGNSISNPSTATYGSAVNLQVGDTAGGSACVDMRSQVIGAPTLSAWDPTGSGAAIYAQASNSSTVSFAGYGGGNSDANLESYVSSGNTISTGTSGMAVFAIRATSGAWANGPLSCSVP